MPAWMREPLLHFALLAAAIFALYYTLKPVGAGDKVIVIEPALERELAERFQKVTRRPPTGDELAGLIEGWVQTEVLYREGLALGLDKGDAMIRERVVQNMKANARMQAVVDVAPEAELRAWFDARLRDYDLPDRYDFVAIELRDHRDSGEGETRSLRDQLASGADPLLLGYDPTPFPRQKPDQIRAALGNEFLKQLQAMTPGTWDVIRTDRGWHLVELRRVEPAQPADYTSLRSAVEEDWRREQQLRLAATMIRGLRANYEVQRVGGG